MIRPGLKQNLFVILLIDIAILKLTFVTPPSLSILGVGLISRDDIVRGRKQFQRRQSIANVFFFRVENQSVPDARRCCHSKEKCFMAN